MEIYVSAEQMYDLYIGVTWDSPALITVDPLAPTYNICSHYPGVFQMGVTEKIVCDELLHGSHLLVQLGGDGRLGLCEVEVYTGKEVASSTWNDTTLGGKFNRRPQLPKLIFIECLFEIHSNLRLRLCPQLFPPHFLKLLHLLHHKFMLWFLVHFLTWQFLCVATLHP